MSITPSRFRPQTLSIGRLRAALTTRWPRTGRLVPCELHEATNSGPPSISDDYGATTRQAEIRRLLSQTRTPETAICFLRGITPLSAATPG
jgi:hypothetical protein